jgi:hypothetical protein
LHIVPIMSRSTSMLSVASYGTDAFSQQGHIRAVVTHRYREDPTRPGCISQRLSRPCILHFPCFYLTVLICISRCCVHTHIRKYHASLTSPITIIRSLKAYIQARCRRAFKSNCIPLCRDDQSWCVKRPVMLSLQPPRINRSWPQRTNQHLPV